MYKQTPFRLFFGDAVCRLPDDAGHSEMFPPRYNMALQRNFMASPLLLDGPGTPASRYLWRYRSIVVDGCWGRKIDVCSFKGGAKSQLLRRDIMLKFTLWVQRLPDQDTEYLRIICDSIA